MILLKLFTEFFKLGLFAVGGGIDVLKIALFKAAPASSSFLSIIS